MVAWPTVAELNPGKRYTIVGNYVRIEEDRRDVSPTDPSNEQDVEVERSSNTVVISRTIESDEGEVQTIELSRGVMSNGKIILEGEVDEPTCAKISVETDDGVTLSARTLLVPSQVVKFVLLDHQRRSEQDWLVLVGTLKLATDSTKRFTIAGDLTGVDEERYPMPMVLVHGPKIVFGPVQAKDKRFLIEGEIDEPRTVDISVVSNKGLFWGGAEAIIEPNAVISVVVSSRWAQQLVATAGTGKHAEVIGKWRMGEKYLAMEKALDQKFERVRNPAGKSKIENTSTESDEEQGKRKPKESEKDDEEAEVAIVDVSEETKTTLSSGLDLNPAKGCEHATGQEGSGSQEERQELAKSGSHSAGDVFYQKMYDIRNAALQDIAKNVESPFNALLALELDPFVVLGAHTPSAAALPLYDKLTTFLDDDIVTRRVKPARDHLASKLAGVMNNSTLIAGHKAPSFELPTLNGKEVSLSDVLINTEYLYIDFWASWCAPCIGDFPALKDLHTAYSDDGFKILTISIDSSFDNWREAAENLEFPWIDLGSIGGIITETPVSYGILAIPAGFLVGKNGCILQKHVRPDKLKEFLAKKFEKQMIDE